MRIISGKYRGQHLKTLSGKNTRPTTDKVKEAIFNLLGVSPNYGAVLDLFAGSAALAIEAVSRGATSAVVVDRSRSSLQIAQDNVKLLHDDAKLFTFYHQSDQVVLPILATEKLQFDLIFLDPPYAQQKIIVNLQTMLKLNLIADLATIVVETDQKVELPATIGCLSLWKERTYGITKIRIYQNK